MRQFKGYRYTANTNRTVLTEMSYSLINTEDKDCGLLYHRFIDTSILLCYDKDRKQRGKTPRKGKTMFNLRYTFTASEYERDFVSCVEREGYYEVRPYENGKSKRLNSPE